MKSNNCDETIKIFVYGTLKEGGLLDYFPDLRINCEKDIVLDGYEMYSVNGAYPAVLEGYGTITGEVHTYPKYLIHAFDRIESEGYLYIRNQMEDGTYIYLFNHPVNYLDKIEGGVW